ncbi:MAG TPA: hypothetical protein VFL57_05810 [Bryobacteraceae bacterium]|nr:hypothetical protein [Bryobacteraceae bacterium]
MALELPAIMLLCKKAPPVHREQLTLFAGRAVGVPGHLQFGWSALVTE